MLILGISFFYYANISCQYTGGIDIKCHSVLNKTAYRRYIGKIYLLGTSNDCGFRILEEAVRFTNRLAFACPALSSSSLFEIAELSADGNKYPLIFTSSNFCSKIVIFAVGTSFLRRSTLSLSPKIKHKQINQT